MGEPPLFGAVKFTAIRPLSGVAESEPGALGVVDGVAELKLLDWPMVLGVTALTAKL